MAGPDDPTLGLDASDWFATVDKVNASTIAFSNRMNALATQLEETGAASSNFVLKISDMDAEGRKLTATIKNTEEGMRVFGRAVTQTTGIQEANLRKTREQTAAFRKQVEAQAAATAQQLKNQFLPAAGTRTVLSTDAERAKVLREVSSIQNLIAQGRISATRANAVIAETLSGSTATFTGASRQVQTIAQRLIQSSNNLGSAWQRTANQVIQQNAAQNKSFKQVGEEGQQAATRILISWRDLFRIFAIQALHNVIRALINAMRESVQTASQFEIRISEIRTLSQDSQLSFSSWAKSVRALSDEFGNPILDVAEGTYEAISNQIAKGAEVAEFMAKALKFSQVTVSTTADSVNLLSSVINAYKLNVSDVDKVSAQLFRTIDLGRVRAQDLANEFGRVAPVAANLGISLEELNAAIATITIQGVTPSETLTSIFGIMNKLLKPTDEMVKFLNGLGFASGRAAIAALGFDGVLRKIVESANKGNVELSDLFNEIRSTRGIVAITRALDNYGSTLNAIRTDSMQKFLDAQEIINESSGKRFEIQLNRIKNIFVTDFGQGFVQAVVNIGNAAEGSSGTLSRAFTGVLQLFGQLEKTTDSAGKSVFQLSDILRALITTLSSGITAWLTYKATVVVAASFTRLAGLSLTLQSTQVFALEQGYRGLTASIIAYRLAQAQVSGAAASTGVALAATASALSSVVTVIGLVVGGYLILKQQQKAQLDAMIRKHQDYRSNVEQNLDSETVSFIDALRQQEGIQVQALDERIKKDLEYVAKARVAYFDLSKAQKDLQKETSKALRDTLDLNIDAMQSSIKELEEQAKKSSENIKNAQNALFTQQENLTSGRFNRQIKLLPEPDQIKAMFAEVERLQKEAAQKISAPTGDANVAAENLKQANKLQEQADRITNDLLEKQVDLTKRRKELEEQIGKLDLSEQDTANIREQRKNVEDLAKLEAQARVSTGRKKNDLLDEIKLRKQAAQEQLQTARDSATDDQRAERHRQLDEELNLIISQQAALGTTQDLEAGITKEVDKRRIGLLGFNKMNNDIRTDAQKQLDIEKKHLETLKTTFADLSKFKLPEIKTPVDAKNAIDEFDKQTKAAIDAGLKDQNVLFEIAKKRTDLQAQADLEIQKHTLDTNAETLEKEKQNLVKQLDDLKARREKAAKAQIIAEKVAPDIIETIDQIVRRTLPNIAKTATVAHSLQSIFEKVSGPTLDTQSAANVEALFTKVIGQIQDITGKKASEITAGDTNLGELSKRFLKEFDTMVNGPEQEEELKKQQELIDKRLEVLGLNLSAAEKQLEATKSATDAQIDFSKAISSSIISVQQLQDATRTAADHLLELSGQHGPFLPPQQGPLHRAGGGWIPFWSPRGTDTVPAMLTPGEFVVKAAAASKFRHLLEDINTRYYAGGGSVSHVSGSSNFKIPQLNLGDTSIGDIHIHGIPVTGNETVDAQRMGRAIRNEIRKGTILPPRSQE